MIIVIYIDIDKVSGFPDQVFFVYLLHAINKPVFLLLRKYGWASFLGNDRSFTRTNGTIQNDPIVPKKNEGIERVR